MDGGPEGQGALQGGEVGGHQGGEGGGGDELLPLGLSEATQQLAQGRGLSDGQRLGGRLLVGGDVLLDERGCIVLVSKVPWIMDFIYQSMV